VTAITFSADGAELFAADSAGAVHVCRVVGRRDGSSGGAAGAVGSRSSTWLGEPRVLLAPTAAPHTAAAATTAATAAAAAATATAAAAAAAPPPYFTRLMHKRHDRTTLHAAALLCVDAAREISLFAIRPAGLVAQPILAWPPASRGGANLASSCTVAGGASDVVAVGGADRCVHLFKAHAGVGSSTAGGGAAAAAAGGGAAGAEGGVGSRRFPSRHTSPVVALSWCADDRYLVSADDFGGVVVWATTADGAGAEGRGAVLRAAAPSSGGGGLFRRARGGASSSAAAVEVDPVRALIERLDAEDKAAGRRVRRRSSRRRMLAAAASGARGAERLGGSLGSKARLARGSMAGAWKDMKAKVSGMNSPVRMRAMDE